MMQWASIAPDTSFHCFLRARARSVRWPRCQSSGALGRLTAVEEDEEEGDESEDTGHEGELGSVARAAPEDAEAFAEFGTLRTGVSR